MNKTFYILLIFLLGFFSCTSEKETRNAVISHEDKYWDIEYNPQSFEMTPKNYVNYYWFEAGKIHINQGGYSDYLLEGECKIYTDDNKMLQKGTFSNGLKHGLWQKWAESGILVESIEYKNGLKHGEQILFYDNGSIKLKLKYNNGLLDGKTTEFHPNLTIKETRIYHNNILSGKRQYFTNDNLRSKTENYKDGKLHGKQTIYTKDTIVSHHYNKGELVIPEITKEKEEKTKILHSDTTKQGLFKRMFSKKENEN